MITKFKAGDFILHKEYKELYEVLIVSATHYTLKCYSKFSTRYDFDTVKVAIDNVERYCIVISKDAIVLFKV
jgi:hypothetical protein